MRAAEIANAILSRFPSLHERVLDREYRDKPLPSHQHPTIGDDAEAIFADIMTFNRWNDGESASGVGSNSRYTRRLRRELPALLKRLRVRVLLDVPCGDFAWMSKAALGPEVSYIGGDIVGALVERLQRDFGSPQRRFLRLDVVSSALPAADLLLCRDCFIHLSNADALAALENIVRADIGHLLATTYRFGRLNADIATGQFRAVNLEAPPFSLPPPLETIVDYVHPFPPRRLALWSREQLRAWREAR